MVIHEESCKGVPYISRMIADSMSWKQTVKPKVYLQNYIVSLKEKLIILLFHLGTRMPWK